MPQPPGPSPVRALCLVLAVSLTSAGPAEAGHYSPQAAAHAIHQSAKVPLEELSRPIGLNTGIGQVTDGVFSENAEAQRYYDQGLTYLHSFVWIEAARSFNQALRLDPSLAMADVGLSYALIELSHPQPARAAVEKAQAAAASGSAHARWHIENRALQLGAEEAPGDKTRFAAWQAHLDKAMTALPDDAEFLLLRGIAAIGDPGDRGQASVAASIPFYERALKASPDHMAAHHYLAHADENSGRIDEALAHAKSYASLAPRVPHARHMYGHSLRRAGRVAEAIVEFRAADRLHKDAIARKDVGVDADWHYAHNLDLLAASLWYQGQMKAAEPLLKQSFALPTTLLVQMINKREWTGFLLARGRPDEALAAANVLASHPNPVVQAAGHIEAAFARLARNAYADAAQSSNAALKAMKQAGPLAGLVAISMRRLQGEFLLRTAAREKGREAMEDAANALRRVTGPDAWSQSLFALEAMTRTARQVGDWELAERLAAQMMAHDDGYGGAYFERGLVERHADKFSDADKSFALAQKYWATADRDLPQLAEMKRK